MTAGELIDVLGEWPTDTEVLLGPNAAPILIVTEFVPVISGRKQEPAIVIFGVEAEREED